MKQQTLRRKRTALIMILLVALLVGVGGIGLWLRTEQRQYALNRQLIAALVKGDHKQALALVDAGADPNTHYQPTPVPSIDEVVKRLFHRSIPTSNASPAALMISCGAPWKHDLKTTVAQKQRPDDTQLTQAMLTHGATVNARGEGGETALTWAALWSRPKTVRLLLEHRANANAQDKDGATVLEYAAVYTGNSDLVRLLFEHGANVNMQDENGRTALSKAAEGGANKDIIRELLAHGANLNLADEFGETPLMRAKENNRPDIVALFKRIGAKH